MPGKNARWVALGILLSRLAGLVRVRVFAHFFGASLQADAWTAALRMPNVLQNLLGEGTLSASFIPIYAELLEEGKQEEAGRFAGAVLGLLAVVAALLAFLGVVLAPLLVGFFFWGFDAQRQDLTVTLVRILFPMTGVLVLSAWALGILNSHRRFFISYVAPVLWNLAMITTLVALGAGMGWEGTDLVVALAWGALVGGCLQLGIQLPFLGRGWGFLRPALSLRVKGVREAIANFLPVVAARGVVNLSSWLDYALAAWLTAGAVAILGYAHTLYVLPIALFGLSIAVAELPEMSRQRREGVEVLRTRVAGGVRQVEFFVIPSAVAFVFLGDQVVGTLYRTGAFGASETLVTWAVLAAYAPGLLATTRSRLFSSAFYALRDTRTPARLVALRVAIGLGAGALLMFPMDGFQVGELGLGAAGLAMGTTLGAWVEYFLLRRALESRVGGIAPQGSPGVRSMAAAAGALGGTWLIAGWVGSAVERWPPWVEGLGTLTTFGVLYLLLATLFRVNQLGPWGRPPTVLPQGPSAPVSHESPPA
ncbi:MAG: murein biosynthesis integral membrane protein MurJ [Gemmatimonadota bacterium]